MKNIRVFEAFSGIGAQAMSLKRLQADYPDMLDFEFVGTSEIEPSAIKAYNAVHGDVKCYGDITKIDWNEVPDFDLFTMSSPCQDFSVAGRQAGAEEGSGTRSSLLWECRKAIIAKRPKYILFENVSAVVSKKFIRGFNKWQAELEDYGYINFAKVLNSKDFGCPQNRERIFMLSIRDCERPYHFPQPFKLEKRIKDILEPYGTVDESYYFTPEQLLRIIAHSDRKVAEGCGFKNQFQTEDEVSGCITTKYGQRETDPFLKEPALIQRLSMYDDNAQAGRIYDVEGISPCLDTCCGGNRMPKILTHVRTEEAKRLRRMGIEVFGNREHVPREDGVSNTITTVQKDNMLMEPAIIQRPHGFNDGGEFNNVAPTITTSSWDNNNLLKEPCILGYTRDRKGNVTKYHDKDVANTVHTFTGGGWNTDQFVKEPVAVAQRGRNPQNPSDRTKGAPTEQRLEFGDKVANCVTTVQKDSMVAEPHCITVHPLGRKLEFKGVGEASDIAPCLRATDYKCPHVVWETFDIGFDNLPNKTVLKDDDGKGYLWQDGSLWRVRKLVPIEVFRLQGLSDKDAKKIIEVCNKTACYRLAGNSITIDVLYHIFRKLWIDTENESLQKSLFD